MKQRSESSYFLTWLREAGANNWAVGPALVARKIASSGTKTRTKMIGKAVDVSVSIVVEREMAQRVVQTVALNKPIVVSLRSLVAN